MNNTLKPIFITTFPLPAFDWREVAFPLKRMFHYEIIKYWKHEHPEFPFPLDSNCAGCHHKSAVLINQNYKEDPDILTWFSLQEKKKKYNTWHDDKITYEKKFEMQFTESIDFDLSRLFNWLLYRLNFL